MLDIISINLIAVGAWESGDSREDVRQVLMYTVEMNILQDPPPLPCLLWIGLCEVYKRRKLKRAIGSAKYNMIGVSPSVVARRICSDNKYLDLLEPVATYLNSLHAMGKGVDVEGKRVMDVMYVTRQLDAGRMLKLENWKDGVYDEVIESMSTIILNKKLFKRR